MTCRFIDAFFRVIVLVISRLLNVFTGGSGKEDFSKRVYRKAMIEGGWSVHAMRAVDWLFSLLPNWSAYASNTHCADVYQRAVDEAYALTREAEFIRELQAKERNSV